MKRGIGVIAYEKQSKVPGDRGPRLAARGADIDFSVVGGCGRISPTQPALADLRNLLSEIADRDGTVEAAALS